MKVILVTDSTADIPAQLAQQLDIHIVPLKVHIDDESFLDGIDITPDIFFSKLSTAAKFPITSQPSPSDFEKTYWKIAGEHGSEVCIISLHLSSALSGTCQSAALAKSMIPELDITVIDSKKGAFMLGMIVVEAAISARNGKTKEECIDLIHKMIKEQKEYFVIDTLDYLQKGGRIGRAQALVGSILNVKPILSLSEQGEVYAFDKVRGKKKAVSRMLEVLKEYAGDQPVICSVIYAANQAEAEELKHRINQEFYVKEMYTVEIGPVIGAHIGPHALATAMYKV